MRVCTCIFVDMCAAVLSLVLLPTKIVFVRVFVYTCVCVRVCS